MSASASSSSPGRGRFLAALVAATVLVVTFGQAPGSAALDHPSGRFVGRSVPTPVVDHSQVVQPASATGVRRVAVVGDIARAGGGQDVTAALAESLSPYRVVIPGDVAYPDGSAEDFANWFDPSYGVRFPGRIWPVPGNHEYYTPNAQGYRDYFGVTGPTWWVRPIGAWVIIGLDSELTSDPAQMTFLRDSLVAYDGTPTIVTWHRARFSTGEHGNDLSTKPYWQVAARDPDVRILLWGHDHDYERMSIPVRGRSDVQAFVVGTGGGLLRPFGFPRSEYTVTRIARHFGVLSLRLGDGGWKWAFLLDDGRTVDAGYTPL